MSIPWLVFVPPVAVEESGVFVLKRLKTHSSQRLTFYWVRYLCCGFEGRISHESILSRARKGTQTCRNCCKRYVTEKAREGKRKQMIAEGREPKKKFVEPLIVNFPEWEPPPSAVTGQHWIWEDPKSCGDLKDEKVR